MIIPPPTELSDYSIHSYRLLLVHLLEYACDGRRGRSETDPVYLHEITESRDQGAMRRRYSSCADLLHWAYYRIGVRLSWVNRKEHTGWRVGLNIAMLAGAKEARPALATQRFLPGDGIVIANAWPSGRDAHALMVIEHDGETLSTAEYGQPGGALRERTYRAGLIGDRRARVVLPLASVLRSAARQGLLVAADDPTRANDGEPTWTP